MIALVTYPYRDRETLAVHLVGEEVELTDERFAELSAGGHVDLPPRRRPPRSPSRTMAPRTMAPRTMAPRTRTSWTTSPSGPCTRSLHPR